uniref:Ammonium transporter AmtB-like domain-containing protein n=1 Tax=Ditylenchus dipsaci TaxID=166011 RepID=A0A915CYW7_9BILA
MAADAKSKWNQHQFTIVLTIFQILFLILFAVFSEHKAGALPGGFPETEAQIKYTDFQDIHIAVIVGFGFLVAFLRRYSFASFGISLLLAAFAIEWALIVRGFLSDEFSANRKFNFSIYGLINADFTAAVVLISFGVLFGKLSPIQYLMLAVLEVPVAVANEWLVVKYLKVQDVGGSAIIHLFAAVFGLVVSRITLNKNWAVSEDQDSVYHSEVFTFIGAAFLWVFWPAFNAVNTVGDARYRAIINSYIALVASTVVAFLVSQAVSKTHHFNIRHIVSASLAGGVALGATANLLLQPWHAFVVGSVAGIISILSFQYITPSFNNKWSIADTRGVLSLHGLPGLVGVLASAIFLFIYPSNAFPETSKILAAGRNANEQALYQLLAAVVTIVVGAVGGVITGVLLKASFWNQVHAKEYFSDGQFFNVPEDYEFTTRVTSKIDRVEINEKVVAASSTIHDPEVIKMTTTTTTTTVDEASTPLVETPAV